MVFPNILRTPDSVSVRTDSELLSLKQDEAGIWSHGDIEVATATAADRIAVTLQAGVPVRTVTVRWRAEFVRGTRFLGDAWERGYGDLEWRGLVPERVMPWFFLATHGAATAAYGVETAPNALCFWRVDGGSISLSMDVGNGDCGVLLGDRRLEVATVRALELEAPAFQVARQFCDLLCAKPRLPKQPVYGGNDWYYAYGNNSRDSILRDSALIAELSPSTENRPFMVIDDGWQGCRVPENGGPWDISSARFGDMGDVATAMKDIGVRPGLWFRPLLTTSNVPQDWRFGRRGGARHLGGLILDPSVPQVLEWISADMRRFRDWGYELVKHDFSMWDIFGRWGMTMNDAPAGKSGWHFADRSRTSAEIVKAFFGALRDAAGDDVMLMGCNTMGHLGAGLFELQRTGDDTSGEHWERTRKMGVNTLAFRMPQHDTFFAVDADCVGLTNKIPWELNRQWLDILARSGTPLFVSADPQAVGPTQKSALRKAFERAATPQEVAEPLDWLDTTCPQQWRSGEEILRYNWFE